MVVTELAVIAFRDGRAMLLETSPGITADQVVAATEAEIAISPQLKEMSL
jgi:acyl CoA:acetate/3-ketoacid CoA transferase beta subunit